MRTFTRSATMSELTRSLSASCASSRVFCPCMSSYAAPMDSISAM